MADPNRHDFGASLREARERAGITLRAISANTKISVLTLEALERNDVSRLPGGVFTRAFVRSYAKEIHLDPEETLNQFLERFPEVAGDADLHEPAAEGIEGEPRTGGARVLRLAAWLVPVLAGVVYFAFVRPGLEAPPVARSTAASEQAPLPAPPPPPAPADTRPGGEAIDPPPTAASPAVQPAAAELATPTGGEVPNAPPAAVPDGALRVTLAPRGPCWVSVRSGGQVVYSGLMQAGERRDLELRGDIAVTAGDAAALSLAINGEPARALGDTGKVVTVRFSLETYRELLEAR
ncbi:MAG TPA: DUF4115 domain-containing protein [Vicinamibacterales bacterium]|nr:DUF4115 domain-containing protein [Vicinamibacterales bacterium]